MNVSTILVIWIKEVLYISHHVMHAGTCRSSYYIINEEMGFVMMQYQMSSFVFNKPFSASPSVDIIFQVVLRVHLKIKLTPPIPNSCIHISGWICNHNMIRKDWGCQDCYDDKFLDKCQMFCKDIFRKANCFFILPITTGGSWHGWLGLPV